LQQGEIPLHGHDILPDAAVGKPDKQCGAARCLSQKQNLAIVQSLGRQYVAVADREPQDRCGKRQAQVLRASYRDGIPLGLAEPNAPQEEQDELNDGSPIHAIDSNLRRSPRIRQA